MNFGTFPEPYSGNSKRFPGQRSVCQLQTEFVMSRIRFWLYASGIRNVRNKAAYSSLNDSRLSALAYIVLFVQTNTILFSTTSLFTFLISVVWLKEPFTLFKLAMIMLAMLGTVIVGVSDAKSKSQTPNSGESASGAALGDGLTLLSSLLYAVYATFLKYKIPEENDEDCPQSPSSGKPGKRPVSISLVFGYLGLLSGVFLLPCLAILALTGLESLRWMGAKYCGLLIVKGEKALRASLSFMETPSSPVDGLNPLLKEPRSSMLIVVASGIPCNIQLTFIGDESSSRTQSNSYVTSLLHPVLDPAGDLPIYSNQPASLSDLICSLRRRSAWKRCC